MTNRQQEYQFLILELESIPPEMTQISSATAPRARRRNIARRIAAPAATFLAVLFVMAITVNIFPPVAYAFDRVPVLRQIAAAVNFSPSLTTAIKHDFVQYIGQEQTINGITMRVEYVIVDRRQENIFYTLNSPVYSYLNSWRPSILCAETGQHAQVAIIGGGFDLSRGVIRRTTVEFFREQVPAQLIFRMEVVGTGPGPRIGNIITVPVPATAPTCAARSEFTPPEPTAIFTFILELDPLFTEQGEAMHIYQDFVLDGQLMTLTTVEIYPTHMRVTFSACEANTAWLRSLRFYVKDERGRRFEAINEGITAFGLGHGLGDDGTRMMTTHNLHSPFFAESEYLTLFIYQVEWLDKDMMRTRIDLANGTAERLPEGVTLYEARRVGDSWHLEFDVLRRAENHNHGVFCINYYCENGVERHLGGWSTSSIWDNLETFRVQFWLVDYPYGVVYLTPQYSRVVTLCEPVSLRVR